MEYIIPRVDIAFKKLFGVEENKDLLISLINSIVSAADQVAEITLLNPYNPKNFAQEKLSILDIKAKAVDGKRFNIKIQISDEADYDKRALYYWAKLYTEQLQQGDDYSLLSKAIGIHILNFTYILESSKYHNVFHITEQESGARYFKELELHTIELKKFSSNSNEELTELIAKIKTKLDIWVAFLTRHDLLNKDNLPQVLNNSSLKKALAVLDIMNFSNEERDAYEGHLKWLRIETNTLKKYEKQGLDKGIAKGIAQGMAQGIAQGMAQGIAQGMAQGIVEGRIAEKQQMAHNMLQNKLPLSTIQAVTGLSNDDMQSLYTTYCEMQQGEDPDQ